MTPNLAPKYKFFYDMIPVGSYPYRRW